MPNWLASELCMGASFALGAWKTFKVLKDGGTDYNLLKTWCLLGFLRCFEGYFEFMVSWVPFYWFGKCLGLGLLFLPDGNVSTVVFEKVVVWGMDQAHDIVNNLVLPSVVEFVVTLPWRLLLVVFPTLPPATSSDAYAESGLRKSRGRLAMRLQHLRMPVATEGQSLGVEKESPPKGNARQAGIGRVRNAASTVKPQETFEVDSSLGDNKIVAPSGAAGGGDARKGENLGQRDARAGGEDESPGRKQAPEKSPETSMSRSRPRRESPSSERSSRSPQRRSFGEMVRSAITGDFKIRVRDHLFDLKTASPSVGFATTPESQGSAASRASPGQQESESDDRVSGEASKDHVARVGSARGKEKRHVASEKVGAGKDKQNATASPAAQPRYMTRQRCAEKSKASAEGGGRGGSGDPDVPGGKGNGSSGMQLRRRGGPERSPSHGRAGPVRAGNSSGVSLRGRQSRGRAPSTPSRRGSGSAGRSTSAESRAARLQEWRRKRTEQIEAQQTGSVKRNKPAIAFGMSSSRGATAGEDEQSEASVRTRVSTGGSRRFRHVERFRAEVSGATGEANQPGASHSSPKAASSPGASSTGSRD